MGGGGDLNSKSPPKSRVSHEFCPGLSEMVKISRVPNSKTRHRNEVIFSGHFHLHECYQGLQFYISTVNKKGKKDSQKIQEIGIVSTEIADLRK